jgi:hypothetical protein
VNSPARNESSVSLEVAEVEALDDSEVDAALATS